MRFPRFHIATSVVNRILNLADDEQMLAAQAAEAPAIPATDTTMAGQALDKAIATPVPAVPAPAGSEEAALVEMQQGGSAADALGSLGMLDSL